MELFASIYFTTSQRLQRSAERHDLALPLREAQCRLVAEAPCVGDGLIVVRAGILGLVRVRGRDDRQFVRRRDAHEILVRRDLRNRIAVKRTRVDIDRHLSLFHRAHGALQERRDVKIGEVAEEADVERMPEHIVEL